MIDTDSIRDYDTGLISDYGGGDVDWWQDYIRSEIGCANDYWRGIFDAQAEENKRMREALEYYADRDNMAVIQHDIWSSWVRFMFSTGSMTIFNEWTMSPDRVERWKRQMNTTYIGLTPDEKETDCKVIDEFRITDKAQAALKPTEEGHWDCVCTNPTPSSPSVEGKRKCLFCAREMVYRTALKPDTEEGE